MKVSIKKILVTGGAGFIGTNQMKSAKPRQIIWSGLTHVKNRLGHECQYSKNMRLENGEIWPVSICLDIPKNQRRKSTLF